MHLDASGMHEQLARNIKLRDKYLLLYDVVTTLARSGQQRIANIAAATRKPIFLNHLIETNIFPILSALCRIFSSQKCYCWYSRDGSAARV